MTKYVVICEDLAPDDKPHWYLTTRRPMTWNEAAEYVKGVHPERHPRIVALEDFITMLPRGIEVTP